MKAWYLIVLIGLVSAACLKENNVPSFEEQLQKDTAIIDEYLTKNSITPTVSDASGVRILITTMGTGAKPTISNSVKVNYTGKLMSNGSVFDQSTSPVTFPLSNLITGWQIGFPYLPTGSKATLYIPSGLGYGVNGSRSIPSNANLIFDVELIGVQ
jgi:FKBP-type peptidyl-prolyl cis-trans isomerases 1